jgi:hypothetical protein
LVCLFDSEIQLSLSYFKHDLDAPLTQIKHK